MRVLRRNNQAWAEGTPKAEYGVAIFAWALGCISGALFLGSALIHPDADHIVSAFQSYLWGTVGAILFIVSASLLAVLDRYMRQYRRRDTRGQAPTEP